MSALERRTKAPQYCVGPMPSSCSLVLSRPLDANAKSEKTHVPLPFLLSIKSFFFLTLDIHGNAIVRTYEAVITRQQAIFHVRNRSVQLYAHISRHGAGTIEVPARGADNEYLPSLCIPNPCTRPQVPTASSLLGQSVLSAPSFDWRVKTKKRYETSIG